MSIVDGIIETKGGAVDRLAIMFALQKAFADLCFESNGCRSRTGDILTCDTVATESLSSKLGPNELPCIWITKMVEAIEDECREIRELLPWKHWSKERIGEKKFPELNDRERIIQLALEFVDIWHFLMEAMIFLGDSPEDFYQLYVKKCRNNEKRMLSGYNTAQKNEDDNIAISKE